MAQLTYRDAVVTRDRPGDAARPQRVLLVGEDVAGAGGVFKTTVGLLDEFGPKQGRRHPHLGAGDPRCLPWEPR